MRQFHCQSHFYMLLLVFTLCKQPAGVNLEVKVHTIMQTPVEQLFRRSYTCAEVVMTEF